MGTKIHAIEDLSLHLWNPSFSLFLIYLILLFQQFNAIPNNLKDEYTNEEIETELEFRTENEEFGTELDMRTVKKAVKLCEEILPEAERFMSRAPVICEHRDQVPVASHNEPSFTLSDGKMNGLSSMNIETAVESLCFRKELNFNFSLSLTGVKLTYTWNATQLLSSLTGLFWMSADKVIVGVTVTLPMVGKFFPKVQNPVLGRTDNFLFGEEGKEFLSNVAKNVEKGTFRNIFNQLMLEMVPISLQRCLEGDFLSNVKQLIDKLRNKRKLKKGKSKNKKRKGAKSRKKQVKELKNDRLNTTAETNSLDTGVKNTSQAIELSADGNNSISEPLKEIDVASLPPEKNNTRNDTLEEIPGVQRQFLLSLHEPQFANFGIPNKKPDKDDEDDDDDDDSEENGKSSNQRRPQINQFQMDANILRDPRGPGEPRLPSDMMSNVDRRPIRDPQLPLHDPQLPFHDPQLPLHDPQLPLSDPSLPLRDPQLPLKDPQLPLRDPQLPLRDPQLSQIDQRLLRDPQSPRFQQSSLRDPQSPNADQRPLSDPKSPNVGQMPLKDPQSPNVDLRPIKDPHIEQKSLKDPESPDVELSPIKDPQSPRFDKRPLKDPQSPRFDQRPLKDPQSPNVDLRPIKDPQSPRFDHRPLKDPQSPNINQRPLKDPQLPLNAMAIREGIEPGLLREPKDPDEPKRIPNEKLKREGMGEEEKMASNKKAKDDDDEIEYDDEDEQPKDSNKNANEKLSNNKLTFDQIRPNPLVGQNRDISGNAVGPGISNAMGNIPFNEPSLRDPVEPKEPLEPGFVRLNHPNTGLNKVGEMIPKGANDRIAPNGPIPGRILPNGQILPNDRIPSNGPLNRQMPPNKHPGFENFITFDNAFPPGSGGQMIGNRGGQMIGGGEQMIGNRGGQMIGSGGQMVGGSGGQMIGGSGGQMIVSSGGQMIGSNGRQMIVGSGGQVMAMGMNGINRIDGGFPPMELFTLSTNAAKQTAPGKPDIQKILGNALGLIGQNKEGDLDPFSLLGNMGKKDTEEKEEDNTISDGTPGKDKKHPIPKSIKNFMIGALGPLLEKPKDIVVFLTTTRDPRLPTESTYDDPNKSTTPDIQKLMRKVLGPILFNETVTEPTGAPIPVGYEMHSHSKKSGHHGPNVGNPEPGMPFAGLDPMQFRSKNQALLSYRKYRYNNVQSANQNTLTYEYPPEAYDQGYDSYNQSYPQQAYPNQYADYNNNSAAALNENQPEWNPNDYLNDYHYGEHYTGIYDHYTGPYAHYTGPYANVESYTQVDTHQFPSTSAAAKQTKPGKPDVEKILLKVFNSIHPSNDHFNLDTFFKNPAPADGVVGEEVPSKRHLPLGVQSAMKEALLPLLNSPDPGVYFLTTTPIPGAPEVPTTEDLASSTPNVQKLLKRVLGRLIYGKNDTSSDDGSGGSDGST